MTLPTLIMESSVRDQALKCPRCDSFNTKFCYYNNYNLSQPRHFCKACKRYWTRGGTLRNIPVGGGCRKNKRMAKKSINLPCPVAKNTSTTVLSNTNPLFYNLPEFSSIHDFSLQFPLFDANFSDPIVNNLSNPCSSDLQSQIHLQKEDPGSSSILNSFALSNPQKKLGFDLKNNPSICDSDVFFPFRDNDIVGGNLTFLKDMKNEDYPFENLISNSSLYLNGTWPDVSICESASVSPLI